MHNSYQSSKKLDQNQFITDPSIPEPDNLPIPLGWTLLVRPYPVVQDQKKSSIILPEDELNFLSNTTNIGRVIAIGDCCWTRSVHRLPDGTYKPWVKVGDFVSYPKNVGAMRKFKGVSLVVLVDDEVLEQLPDPQVFDDAFYKINIPEDHLTKYNTIYNPNYTAHKEGKV